MIVAPQPPPPTKPTAATRSSGTLGGSIAEGVLGSFAELVALLGVTPGAPEGNSDQHIDPPEGAVAAIDEDSDDKASHPGSGVAPTSQTAAPARRLAAEESPESALGNTDESVEVQTAALPRPDATGDLLVPAARTGTSVTAQATAPELPTSGAAAGVRATRPVAPASEPEASPTPVQSTAPPAPSVATTQMPTDEAEVARATAPTVTASAAPLSRRASPGADGVVATNHGSDPSSAPRPVQASSSSPNTALHTAMADPPADNAPPVTTVSHDDPSIAQATPTRADRTVVSPGIIAAAPEAPSDHNEVATFQGVVKAEAAEPPTDKRAAVVVVAEQGGPRPAPPIAPGLPAAAPTPVPGPMGVAAGAAPTPAVELNTPLPATTVGQLQEMQQAGQAQRRIVIRLDPPELGTVRLAFTKVGDDIVVAARTETAEAARAILRQQPDVRTAVEALGLTLSEFDVQTPKEQDARHRGPNGRQRGAFAEAATTQTEGEAPPEDHHDEGAIFL